MKKKFLLLAQAMQEISNMQIKQINSKKYNILVVKAKTNSLTCWFCLKIVVFCHLFRKKDVPMRRGYF